MPSAALPMARLYQDRDGFSHSIIFSCVSWFKYSQTSCPFVSIRGHSWFKYSQFSWSIRGPFVSIRVHSWFKYSQFSWSIRVHSWFKYSQFSWSIRVHSCPFVVQVFPVSVFSCVSCVSWFKYSQTSCPFVSIRVHSWFKYSQFPFFRVFRVFRGSSIPRLRVHSCPFVSIRGSSIPSFRVPSWSRPAGFRKKSGFWRDGTIFPEYIKSAMDPRGFSSKTATLQQG